MRFNHNTFPVLKWLQTDAIIDKCYENDMEFFQTIHSDEYKHYWNQYKRVFASNINYVSMPYFEATERTKDKLMEVYRDIVLGDESQRQDLCVSGTYIMGNYVICLHQEMYAKTETMELVCYVFTKHGAPVCYYMNSSRHDRTYCWFSNAFDDVPKENIDTYVGAVYIFKVIMIELFKKYAKSETKVLTPGMKYREPKEKHLNETKLNINYLTSLWFTNLVRSEGFKVSGHFRLQPKKSNGQWTRELIYINEFYKTGYTHKATIEK